MTDTIKIDETSLSTRRYARGIVESAVEEGADALDLGRVEFISRSVADELVHQSSEHDIEIRFAEGDVRAMLDAVRGEPPTA